MDFGTHNDLIAGVIFLTIAIGAFAYSYKNRAKTRAKWEAMKKQIADNLSKKGL